MGKTKKKLLLASMVSAGAALLTATYRKLQKETIKHIEIADKKNSKMEENR